MRRSPSETWMFSVVFWILCSWLPCLADWQVSCSRHVVQLQQNICRQNDCEQEWEITFSPKKTWGSEQNFLRRDLMNIVSQIARNFAWQHLVYTKLAILNNSTCRLTGSHEVDAIRRKLQETARLGSTLSLCLTFTYCTAYSLRLMRFNEHPALIIACRF